MKVIITAGYNQSLHSIGLMHALLKNEHEVVGCLLVKTFQLKRLRTYLRLYGMTTVINKFRSLVLGKQNLEVAKETQFIRQYLQTEQVTTSTVSVFCQEKNIPYCSVENLNTDAAVSFVQDKAPDFLIYSGGGILRKNLIGAPKIGVLNAHSGLLPYFRGMNVIEWSLMHDIPPHTSIHFIDVGIDTGKILHTEKIPYTTGWDLLTLRGRATLHNVELLVKVLNDFNHYHKHKQSQEKKDGRQFFVMHEQLKVMVNKQLLSTGYPTDKSLPPTKFWSHL